MEITAMWTEESPNTGKDFEGSYAVSNDTRQFCGRA